MSEQTKADWRALPAGASLDRVVAERLGWRIEIRIEDGLPEWWVVRSETEYDYVGQSSDFANEDEVWARAFYAYEGRDSAILPLYSRDANATLPLEEGEWIEIHQGWTGHCAARVARTITGKYGEWQEGEALAEARTKAWMAWKDGQRE